MNAKASYTSASLLSLLFAGAALCQAPPTGGAGIPTPTGYAAPAGGYGVPAPTIGNAQGDPVSVVEGPSPIPDPWITYPQPHCCGPVGGDGPILMEIFTRTGVSVPVGGHALTRALGVGWEIGGGGRSLFFNVPRDRAFVVELGVFNTYNRADDAGILFNVQGMPATMRSLNRTFATIGFGEEIWVRNPATSCSSDDWSWRWGYDGGFRYGTVRADTNVPVSLPAFPAGYARLNSRMYGSYLAVHSDLELPRGAFTYILGARLEWQYDWIGIFGSRSDVQAINLLFSAGLRF